MDKPRTEYLNKKGISLYPPAFEVLFEEIKGKLRPAEADDLHSLVNMTYRVGYIDGLEDMHWLGEDII